jgi:cytochrome c biogenesis factor
MDLQATFDGISQLVAGVQPLGYAFQAALVALGVAGIAFAVLPGLRNLRWRALLVLTMCLVAGELVLAWLHWQLYQLMLVVDPATRLVTGRVAAPLWIESEKLYLWALIVGVMGLLMRRQRDELIAGVLFCASVLTIGGALYGQPFTNPLPNLLGQYSGYLQAMAVGGQVADGAFQGMEGARQFYYNAWFMWVHPPLLFFSYGAFVISFLATLGMIAERHSSYETTAYRWARLGYLALTAGMLLGFPWALMSWQGESWWWSGKVNMSIMLWVLYTAYLHARLYLRTRGMWKAVAALAVLSFVILVLTYIATYVVPGAHSYAAAETGRAMASEAGRIATIARGVVAGGGA